MQAPGDRAFRVSLSNFPDGFKGVFCLDTHGDLGINTFRILRGQSRLPEIRYGRVAQGESACLTRKRPVVRNHPCPPSRFQNTGAPEEKPPGLRGSEGSLHERFGVCGASGWSVERSSSACT